MCKRKNFSHFTMGSLARAAVSLERGEPAEALVSLGNAQRLWREVGAPFEEARCRLLKSRACGALDDVDGAELELRAARREFERLGANVPG